MEKIIEGAEVLEPAEPTEVTEPIEGAEALEPAEPVKTETDSAFAEIRRAKEEAEERANETARQNQQLVEALGLYFDGTEPDELIVNAFARAKQKTPEEIQAELENQAEAERLANENQTLQQKVQQMEVEKMMEKGLTEIQSVDPAIKDLSELGEDFPKFIMAGLSSKEAYYAVKAKEAKETIVPPKTIGTIQQTPIEKDFFTSEEVDNMSEAEVEKNLDAIMASMKKWK